MHPCAHKLPNPLFSEQPAAFFPLPHLQQHAQTENLFPTAVKLLLSQPPAVLRRCQSAAVRLQTWPLAVIFFPFPDLTRTFQNTVSLLLSLTAQKAKMAGLVG